MTMPASETLEREKDKLYLLDSELIRRIGVPEKTLRSMLPALESKYGFPRKSPLFGGRRYWPAVTGLPWSGNEYRRKWRKVARKAGIPDNVWNMDSRSGAISEAIQAGAPIEFVRHAATHSDISQTADYDRGQAEATAKVMRMRMESRKKQLGGPDDGA